MFIKYYLVLKYLLTKAMRSLYLVSLFSVLTFGLISCAIPYYGPNYKYIYSLVESSKPVDIGSTGAMHFEDNTISIDFSVGRKQILFVLKNKSPNTIKINWDETLLIKLGKTEKVMHAGVKYIDRNNAQPMSIIPSGTSHNDNFIPTENIYLREGLYSQYISYPSEWQEKDLFPSNYLNKPEIKELILAQDGNLFRVYMPIVVNGVQQEYNFNFKIQYIALDVKPKPN